MAGKPGMRILSIIQGWYGERVVRNVATRSPSWRVSARRCPRGLPRIVERPGRLLPDDVPECDLVLSLGEEPGVAMLLPSIAERAEARAVIAPIDGLERLPPGLGRQVRGELDAMGVFSCFPMPFCSLTETGNEVVDAFAARFGRPELDIATDGRTVKAVSVRRGSPCGSTWFVAEGLTGVELGRAPAVAALRCSSYPCLASTRVERWIGDSLLHIACHTVAHAVKSAIDRATLPP